MKRLRGLVIDVKPSNQTYEIMREFVIKIKERTNPL